MRRMIKVGGSLLDWPELGPRLRTWLARYPDDDNLLIAGGGPAAEWVRAAQRQHAFGEEAAHWLAIRAMQLTAAMLAELLPRAIVATDLAELIPQVPHGRAVIIDVLKVLEQERGTAADGALPASWDVTSDSIAAHLATATMADELVLMKSALPRASTLTAAAEEGYVDRWLPQCWRRAVRCVNLREEGGNDECGMMNDE
jgi:aspartokinase-like uncharacterized kinase